MHTLKNEKASIRFSVLATYMDKLTGFLDAIVNVFPETTVMPRISQPVT